MHSATNHLQRKPDGTAKFRGVRHSGFTLVELLVGLAISTVIAIAAISALTVSRQGFTTADAASQLRDNARFATSLIQRLGVQAGFKDVAFAATNWTAADIANPTPPISGFNNALPSSSDPFNAASTRTTGSVGFGSDVLILRNQVAETFPGSGVNDQSIIDCLGNPPASSTVATDRSPVTASAIYVDISKGEPSLMCSTGPGVSQPIVQGVENFQVLYGVNSLSSGSIDYKAADTYLRADQMTAATAALTNDNWRKVRSLRIGMVIRGPIGSSQDRQTQTFYPFGLAKESSSGTPGFAMSTLDTDTSPDAGTRFTPTVDGRMRQVVTLTVHLRNDQGK